MSTFDTNTPFRESAEDGPLRAAVGGVQMEAWCGGAATGAVAATVATTYLSQTPVLFEDCKDTPPPWPWPYARVACTVVELGKIDSTPTPGTSALTRPTGASVKVAAPPLPTGYCVPFTVNVTVPGKSEFTRTKVSGILGACVWACVGACVWAWVGACVGAAAADGARDTFDASA